MARLWAIADFKGKIIMSFNGHTPAFVSTNHKKVKLLCKMIDIKERKPIELVVKEIKGKRRGKWTAEKQ
jgi:hypothetical protein